MATMKPLGLTKWLQTFANKSHCWKYKGALNQLFHSTPILEGNKKIGNALRARTLSPTIETERESQETIAEEEPGPVKRKSKNQKKREAARAYQWSLEIAEFTPSQVRRIARVASLGNEFIDAVMLVKRLGPDVREGKRRQFNYIGRLLRQEASVELIEELIQATKDGNTQRIRILAGKELEYAVFANDDSEEEEVDEEILPRCMETAKRWRAGLISEDIALTEEVYSLYNVDFNRQELRKLVRNAKKELENELENAENIEGTPSTEARDTLLAFLFKVAKLNVVETY